jgi:hypothetical protein
MLNNLSEQIRNCYLHAEDCARKAAAQTDPQLKRDFLDSERRWLLLAQSYDFSRRLNDFSVEAKRRTDSPPRVYYALHVRLKDGHEQTEFSRRGLLPKLGGFITVVVSGDLIQVRVLNVITAPSPKEHAELIYYIYAVEI